MSSIKKVTTKFESSTNFPRLHPRTYHNEIYRAKDSDPEMFNFVFTQNINVDAQRATIFPFHVLSSNLILDSILSGDANVSFSPRTSFSNRRSLVLPRSSRGLFRGSVCPNDYRKNANRCDNIIYRRKNVKVTFSCRFLFR